MTRYLITQHYTLITDCVRKILINAEDEEDALILYQEIGDEAGKVILDSECNSERYELGEIEVEFYIGNPDGN